MWPIIENAFLVFFLIELTVRLIVDGPVAFFCGSKSAQGALKSSSGVWCSFVVFRVIHVRSSVYNVLINFLRSCSGIPDVVQKF